jgi:hypothetical protein
MQCDGKCPRPPVYRFLHWRRFLCFLSPLSFGSTSRGSRSEDGWELAQSQTQKETQLFQPRHPQSTDPLPCLGSNDLFTGIFSMRHKRFCLACPPTSPLVDSIFSYQLVEWGWGYDREKKNLCITIHDGLL